MAQKDPGIIGDFVWTGIDHLGEVGLGAWEYKDYAPTYIHTKGWLTSGSGRIDITGKPLPEAFFILASYGMLKKPVIAVVPPNHNGERHSPSGWKMTNAVSSWAWEGCEGLQAKVEVYSCGDVVELYLNDKKIARKSCKHSCRAKFSIPYRHGVITAIAYDKNKMEIGRSSLHSAEGETRIILEAEDQKIEKGMLCYIRMKLAGANGVTNVLQRQRIKVSVSGGTLVGLGHACPYNDEGYVSDSCSTYFGEAMAIVRAETSGEMTVKAVCQLGQAEAKVLVE
ncbi:MAG TPA: DUF4982 domain-containing protein [Candidatus Limiplasma sp.]|nr:DUF4982 domain-containing protein [Candidatus Limiplasma sp.]HRX08225.1 DUF4982 domain-containing protein [Candidatus Limiplasma sp.]